MQRTILIGAAIIGLIFTITVTKKTPTQEITNERRNGKEVKVIAENLAIPWEIAFLPNQEILITERPGTLKKISADGKSYPIEGVHHIGEGGLLGLVLHPDFEKNHFLYLYLTTRNDRQLSNNSEHSEPLSNRVERYRFENNSLTDRIMIIENIPGASHHDGGRIAFGPDGYLYITTGDAEEPELAQDKSSLAGKILRLKDDGSIPSDNPFGTTVFSYGHRNPQGLAWDDKGRLWATEHGSSAKDELNLIEKGANYGWPAIRGDDTRSGMRKPLIHSGPDETWAPSGALFWKERIFFAGLRGESLYEARISPEGSVTELKAHFREQFGRLRAIRAGPDGYFYLLTSNTDGRGSVREGDDKLIRVNPSVF